MIHYALGLLLCAISLCVQARNVLITEISQEQGEWYVEYISHVPIKSIQFPFSPDRSRQERWQLLDDQFTFLSSSSADTLIRKNNSSFKQVKFKLTPTYIHLPKAYAPFSPFSDGSLLIHSGRFFACSELCSIFDNQWYLSLSVDTNENIYHGGKSYKHKVAWWDSNDGSKIYVGHQLLSYGPNYTSVVDQGLPKAIRQALSDIFPKMMEKLALRYGSLINKPMLYASFGQTEGPHFGRQGGVLPKQVFMHWYGKLPKESEHQEFELLWFFAHEVAHLYQGNIGGGLPEHLAWLHEGHAEFIAMQLLSDFSNQFKQYAEITLQNAEESCQQFHENKQNNPVVKKVDYRLFYQCGLLAYDLIAQANDNNAVDKLWLDLVSASTREGFDPETAFLNMAQLLLNNEQYNQLIRLVSVPTN